MRWFVRAALTILVLMCAAAVVWKWPRTPAALNPPEIPAGVRLLTVADPFARAMQAHPQRMSELFGVPFTAEVFNYGDSRTLAMRHGADKANRYDLIAVDVVWLGEYLRLGLLAPLDDVVADPAWEAPDVVPQVLAQGRHGGHVWLLPIQPHSELLWYRTDLFAAAGLAPPTNLAAMLAAARTLHHPERGVYGLCWNGQRGQPLGQTMAHLYGAVGQPLLDGDGRPTLDGPRARLAVETVRGMLNCSTPDVLSTAWDQRALRFVSGAAAMTYGWGARASLIADPDQSTVAGRVGFAAPPVAEGVAPVAPLGTWGIGVPSNLDPRRLAEAKRAAARLTGPQGLRLLAELGSAGVARMSIMRDARLQAQHPTFPLMAELAEHGRLSDAMRPPVPQWSELCEILGTVYHDMLQGRIEPEDAIGQAQRQALALFGNRP